MCYGLRVAGVIRMETIAKYMPRVEVVTDSEQLAHRSVDIFVDRAKKAIEEKGVFCVAISGGHTPQLFFEMLGGSSVANTLSWEKIQLFWVDERCVSPKSELSNYKLAADTFLFKVNIPVENIHRIPTEHDDIKVAARCYEGALRRVFNLKEGQLPCFDLVVLGMGADGHTGSLFPNSYASFDTEDLACVVYDALDNDINRITLTHPVLCAASHLVVLVSGEEKSGILKKVLSSEADEVKYPIHVLWPILDKVTWLVDGDAAKLL